MVDQRIINRCRKVRHILEVDPQRRGNDGSLCEGQAFLPHHFCSYRGFELNEVLIPRNVFQKLPVEKQLYFFDKVNCSLNCRGFHARYGHSKDFRVWFERRVTRIYGRETVEAWLAAAPLKEKVRLRGGNA